MTITRRPNAETIYTPNPSGCALRVDWFCESCNELFLFPPYLSNLRCPHCRMSLLEITP